MQWAQVQKHGLVSRKEKDSRSAVFRISKGYEAAGAALRGRFAICIMVMQFHLKESILVQFQYCTIKNAKPAPVLC